MSYKNFAFISYSHKDMTIAKWLQKQLERFKLPTEIHNEINSESRYLRPIFRDESDLNTGILGDELRKNLEESKYLILICSQHSRHSQWVSDEAKAFVDMGRLSRIIPVIVPDGCTTERDLFPCYLRDYFQRFPDKELLGINIGIVGRDKALIRVVSRMLDITFDSLWKRHQRQKRIRSVSILCLTGAVLTCTYLFAVPIRVNVQVELQTSSLPIKEEIVMHIDGGEYESGMDNPIFNAIQLPGYKRFSNVSVNVQSQFFMPIDTIIPVGFGLHRDITLKMKRDSSFSIFKGFVYDDCLNPLSGVEVTINSYQSVTSPNGGFSIILPLEDQKIEQNILLSKEGYISIIREDETPGTELKFIMHRNK